MRIVYDDYMQDYFDDLLREFMGNLHCNIKSVVSYEWGTDRVQMGKVKEKLNNFLANYYMEIGNTVTHAHGIGNNCKYPVYYHAENEIQHCADINLNTGMYGEGYVSIEDYNGHRIGMAYELHTCGIKFKW